MNVEAGVELRKIRRKLQTIIYAMQNKIEINSTQLYPSNRRKHSYQTRLQTILKNFNITNLSSQFNNKRLQPMT